MPTASAAVPLQSGPGPARIRPVWARALREQCTRMSREDFERTYPHAWLVAGLRGEQDLPSLTVPVGEGEGTDASGVLSALRWYVDRIELFPLAVRADDARAQHLLLGRAWSNHLALRHTSISKEHAVLTYAQGAWAVRDRNSTNGTWAHGAPVLSHRAPTPLRAERSLLRFGTVTCALVLRTGDIHDALAPRAGG